MTGQNNRLFTADKIHDGNGWLPAGTAIEVTDNGTIVAVHEQATGSATHLEGILTPGFVNAHCHLELSHMKGVVPEKTGLIPFLKSIPTQRNNFTDEQKKAARHQAYEELVNNGVIAVGDIANSIDTLDIRELDQLHMHTFVECIGFTAQFAQARLDYSLEVLAAFITQKTRGRELRQSVIPHAPYSVSGALFRLLNEAIPGSLISIHNQESRAEDEYYRHKTGAVRELLAMLGIDDTFFEAPGKSSLQSYLPVFSPGHAMLLVHNTYTPEEDMLFAEGLFPMLSWCLCPNANLYIEDALPDINMLRKHTKNICIGTDSLASNHQLSVLAELTTLKKHFPELEWEELIRWGTQNGAKALQMDAVIGSFEPGKQPGLVQISDLESSPRSRRIL